MFIRATLRRFAPQELLALKTVQAVFPVREGKLHCLIKNQKTAPPCQMQTQREWKTRRIAMRKKGTVRKLKVSKNRPPTPFA
jgi:hypothetical protein